MRKLAESVEDGLWNIMFVGILSVCRWIPLGPCSQYLTAYGGDYYPVDACCLRSHVQYFRSVHVFK